MLTKKKSISYVFRVTLLTLCTLFLPGLHAEEVTINFADTDGFSGWSNSYTDNSVNISKDGFTLKVAQCAKQTQTVTDVPVAKGSPIYLTWESSKKVSHITLTLKQWSSKAQTVTLNTTTVANPDDKSTYTATTEKSSNFTLSADLAEGITGVKYTFSSTSNQVGYQSVTVTYTEEGGGPVVETLKAPEISTEGETISITNPNTSGDVYYCLSDLATAAATDCVTLYESPIAKSEEFGKHYVHAYVKANADNTDDSKVATASYSVIDPDAPVAKVVMADAVNRPEYTSANKTKDWTSEDGQFVFPTEAYSKGSNWPKYYDPDLRLYGTTTNANEITVSAPQGYGISGIAYEMSDKDIKVDGNPTTDHAYTFTQPVASFKIAPSTTETVKLKTMTFTLTKKGEGPVVSTLSVPTITLNDGDKSFTITNPNESGTIMYTVSAEENAVATDCTVEYTEAVPFKQEPGIWHVHAYVKADDETALDSGIATVSYMVADMSVMTGTVVMDNQENLTYGNGKKLTWLSEDGKNSFETIATVGAGKSQYPQKSGTNLRIYQSNGNIVKVTAPAGKQFKNVSFALGTAANKVAVNGTELSDSQVYTFTSANVSEFELTSTADKNSDVASMSFELAVLGSEPELEPVKLTAPSVNVGEDVVTISNPNESGKVFYCMTAAETAETADCTEEYTAPIVKKTDAGTWYLNAYVKATAELTLDSDVATVQYTVEEPVVETPSQVTCSAIVSDDEITVVKGTQITFTSEHAAALKAEVDGEEPVTHQGESFVYTATEDVILTVTPLDKDGKEYGELSLMLAIYVTDVETPSQVTCSATVSDDEITVVKGTQITFTSEHATALKAEVDGEEPVTHQGDSFVYTATEDVILTVTPLDKDGKEYDELSLMLAIYVTEPIVSDTETTTATFDFTRKTYVDEYNAGNNYIYQQHDVIKPLTLFIGDCAGDRNLMEGEGWKLRQNDNTNLQLFFEEYTVTAITLYGPAAECAYVTGQTLDKTEGKATWTATEDNNEQPTFYFTGLGDGKVLSGVDVTFEHDALGNPEYTVEQREAEGGVQHWVTLTHPAGHSIYYKVSDLARDSRSRIVAADDHGHDLYTEPFELKDGQQVSFFAQHEHGMATEPTVIYAKDVITALDLTVTDSGESIYFDMQGRRIAAPASGICIRVTAGKAEKVIR